MTQDGDIRVAVLEVACASEDDTGLLAASGDVWFDVGDHGGKSAGRPYGPPVAA